MTLLYVLTALVLVAIIVAFLVYRDSNARQDAEQYRRERDRLQELVQDTQVELTEARQRIYATTGQLELVRNTTTDEDAKYLLRGALDMLRGQQGPLERYQRGHNPKGATS